MAVTWVFTVGSLRNISRAISALGSPRATGGGWRVLAQLPMTG
jgi:hypothetical protein